MIGFAELPKVALGFLYIGFAEWQALFLVLAFGDDAAKRIELQLALFNGEIDRRREPSELFLNGRAFESLALKVLYQLAAVVACRILERLAVGERLVQRPHVL